MLKEGIYIGLEVAADSEDAKLPLHGPNQWPREVPLLITRNIDPSPNLDLSPNPHLNLASNRDF